MIVSRDRILTTHVGSLPRNEILSELLMQQEEGKSFDMGALAGEMDKAVRHVVQQQVAAGIDIGNDGEQQRVGFQTYVPQRMTGFAGVSKRRRGREFEEFPELLAYLMTRFPNPTKSQQGAPEAQADIRYRDLKPITTVFKPGAVAEAYISDAPTDDERYYVPLTETVGTRPLLISPTQNRWCDILRSTGAGLVNRHYHPQQVFAYTISGKWGYLEHDWVATAGDFVYEAPGEAHTLVAYESDEPMLVHFNVTGPLIWLDDNGEPEGHFDVHDYIAISKAHYEEVGLGADYIEGLYR